MKHHALVVGSQIDGLRGVHGDTSQMKAMLEAHGFEVELRTGERATRAGILEGYLALIDRCRADDDTGPGDAAVVYFSGHGFLGAVPGSDQVVQCIAPTDLHAGTDDDFRGITAAELSVLQHRLTTKTKNVTVILDCCHSSQMSRDAAVLDAVPRALPHPVKIGVAAHLAWLRTTYGAELDRLDAVGNPDAVRVVASDQVEPAYEYSTAQGGYRGAFTEALLDVLKEVAGAEVSWAAIGDAVRTRVLRRFPTQRPDVEGPARRKLFSLNEENVDGIVSIRIAGDGLELAAGHLTGVVHGDVYGIMPVASTAYHEAKAIAEVEVSEPQALRAPLTLRAWRNGASRIPADAVAVPLVRNAKRRAVALDDAAAARPELTLAIAKTRTLRVAEPGEQPIATLRLAAGELAIADARGPLFPPAPFPDALDDVIDSVANLGVAQAIRELHGDGIDPRELEIELGTVDPTGEQRPLRDHRAALGLRDRFYIQVRNRGERRLFVHVFNVGLQGKVTLLTQNLAPGGVSIERGDPPFVLGRRDGKLRGIGIKWPETLPRAGFPRLDEYFVVVTTTRVSLAALATQPRGLRGARGRGTKLQALIAQVQDGETRDSGDDDEPMEGFLVQRLAYLLHPRDVALGGLAFEVDENPSGLAAAREGEAWLARGVDAVEPATPPEPAAIAPDEIAIRIADLVVENNRAWFSTDVRIDALVCTRRADGKPAYATWTQTFPRISSGERLALENGLLYHGPVRDFVDISLFVSRDAKPSLALARLFEQRANGPDFQQAATALLVTADAAPWVAAVGASAALARIAYELVVAVAGTSIGLYRTSYLRRELFGVGRHPVEGMYRAQDFSFSLLIEPGA